MAFKKRGRAGVKTGPTFVLIFLIQPQFRAACIARYFRITEICVLMLGFLKIIIPKVSLEYAMLYIYI